MNTSFLKPIERSCFQICSNLTEIADEAFAGTNFEAVVIPDTVTSVGSRAFAGCLRLVYVRIPAGLTVPDDAFDGCPNVFIDIVD